MKNVKKCDLQSRACLLALLVGEYLFEAFHWGIEVMRERERNNNINLYGFVGGDANDIDGVATEKPRPSFVGDDLVKDFRERMAMVANHQMRVDGLDSPMVPLQFLKKLQLWLRLVTFCRWALVSA